VAHNAGYERAIRFVTRAQAANAPWYENLQDGSTTQTLSDTNNLRRAGRRLGVGSVAEPTAPIL
jgi:hypothetical protein